MLLEFGVELSPGVRSRALAGSTLQVEAEVRLGLERARRLEHALQVDAADDAVRGAAAACAVSLPMPAS